MHDSKTHPLAAMFRKLCLWANLREEDRAALLALPYTLRSMPAGGHIAREGDLVTHSCLLISGYAYRYKVVGNGGRQILAIHMAGDIVDLQNSLLRTADHGVQVLSTAELAFISREAIQAIAFERPSIGMALWYDTLVDASIHREWNANVGRRDARTRVAHLLCEFGIRLEAAGLGDVCKYELPMTQEQLADATGLTAVHVNRTLMGLDREGLTKRSKRSVIIENWKELARVGDFNSAYLHLAEDKIA